MSELPVSRTHIVSRLKKVEGQVRGVQQMVSDERQCVDILMQLAAVRSAVDSVALLVLENYTHLCMLDPGKDPRADIARAVAMWVGGTSRRH